jgi:outer membrane protein assembly factor BamA
MLSEKGIAAKVSDEPLAPSPNQPLRVAEYRVDSPSVRIHTVTLTGVTPPFAPATDKLVHTLTGSRYNEGLAPGSITNTLLSPYRDAGYQAASLSGLARNIVASTPSRVDVDVAATVTPGDLYHLAKLDWPGSPVLSAEDFNLDTNFKPGAVASQKSLLESLRVLEAAYHNKGYVDVAVTAEPKLDATTHTVVFNIAAIPGAQYTLKSVTPVNLNDAQKKDFDSAWKLHPGDIYNEGYVTSFLKNNTALHSFDDYSASFKTIADPDAHTIDLTVIFVRFHN